MKLSPELERGRIRNGPYGSNPGEDFGAFFIDGPCGRQLKIIASSGDASVGVDWEHVSVSLENRCRTGQRCVSLSPCSGTTKILSCSCIRRSRSGSTIIRIAFTCGGR